MPQTTRLNRALYLRKKLDRSVKLHQRRRKSSRQPGSSSIYKK